MAYASVADLRASPLFQSFPALQKMGMQKLQRFVDVFQRVLVRALRGGASEKEAEAHAVNIALAGVLNTTIMPAGRTAEAKLTYYALFAKDMAHGAGVDTDMKFADVGDANDIAAGQTFFGHTHDRAIAEPLGIIRRIAATSDLPAHVQGEVDRDIVLVAEVSFFTDVPQEDRLETLSPEWSTVTYSNGEKLHIPTNFVTTNEPANAAVLGIKRIAEEGPSGKPRPYLHMITLDATRNPMADEPTIKNLTTKVAELQTALDEAKSSSAKADDYQKKFASLDAKHNDLVKKMAAIAGIDSKNAEVPKEDAVITGLTSKLASLEGKLTTLTVDMEKKEASAWADSLLSAKELPMDSKPKYEALYLLNKEAALSVEATLPARILKPGHSQAVTNLEKLDPKKAEAELAFLKSAFPTPGVTA